MTKSQPSSRPANQPAREALSFSTDVKFVKGVGERIAVALKERGVHTVEDLLYHLPFRYEDRLHPQHLRDLKPGEMASVIGEVRGSALIRARSMPIFELTVGQGLDSVKGIWFRGTYLQGKFKPGQMIALYGKVEASRSRPGAYKMIQPQFEMLPDANATGEDAEFAALEVGRIVPVYQSLGGTTAWGAKLGSKWLRRVLWGLLQEIKEAPESLPAQLRERLGLPGRIEALREVHFPSEGTSLDDLTFARTPALRRLVFEELFYLELGLELKRRRMRERNGIAFSTTPQVREALKQVLPFHPTRAQKRVLGEIVTDMKSPQPMRRLLQGDVGSGKTIVALEAAIVAIENGYQAALMAPTEILATQHYLSARKLLTKAIKENGDRRYRITLLTGSLDNAEKKAARGKIFRGETELVIGTHALLEEKVDFDRLGLIVVDEQHRFGVQQRFALMKKPGAADPDVLVMTATPIPRTLALTMYGDLDVSVLDELPPGRTPIVTRRVEEQQAAKVWEFVRKQVAEGRQAYIVYPLIEGPNDDQPELDFAHDEPKEEEAPKKGSKKKTGELFKVKLKSATEMYEQLGAGPLKGLRLGLLHGRLDAAEKEVIMARFQRGEIDVLLSTTVIEVGVDVPNSTVMVIEHAERFGLAQMHQLRGRVGRGSAKSYCILLTGAKVSPEADQRLDAMVRSQNGFELAEIDLEQRGPGEFFGTRQSGLPEFRVASLLRDRETLELAKKEAASFATNAEGTEEEKETVRRLLKQHWQRHYGLVEA
ncbi:ATP-dependent DNA helicase RecG [Terriglobus tenax]|uniref:ATP-dependent DNA helicase RecG n=1 Tax=Terriglobus tenax TaxID=1111115 RepID=UPI0037D9D9AD